MNNMVAQKFSKKVANILTVSALLTMTACGKVVYDAAGVEDGAEKPLAAVVADKDSGVHSVYVADDAGNVGLSNEAQAALGMAQTAANSSGNAALIALASIASALAGAGATIVAATRKKKQGEADKPADNGEAK